MKSIKIVGLCLAAIFTMGMALAGNASAGLLWLLCLEGNNNPNTRFVDSNCRSPGAGGAWESVAIGNKTDTVRIKVYSLRLRDKATFAGESEIECNSDLTKDAGEGTISNTNEGKIVKAEINKTEVNKRCTRIKGGCKAGEIEEVKGANLPWATKIEMTGTETTTTIENSGAGEPGWIVKCNTLLGSKTDTCTSIKKEYETANLFNELSHIPTTVLLVRARFLKAHNAECSESSGKREGQVEGLVAILLVNGNGLSFNEV
jgi:hypothetical protein